MSEFLIRLSCVGLVVSLCLLVILSNIFRFFLGCHIWNVKEMKKLMESLDDD